MVDNIEVCDEYIEQLEIDDLKEQITTYRAFADMVEEATNHDDPMPKITILLFGIRAFEDSIGR